MAPWGQWGLLVGLMALRSALGATAGVSVPSSLMKLSLFAHLDGPMPKERRLRCLDTRARKGSGGRVETYLSPSVHETRRAPSYLTGPQAIQQPHLVNGPVGVVEEAGESFACKSISTIAYGVSQALGTRPLDLKSLGDHLLARFKAFEASSEGQV
jgi:hypothetical protein